MWNELFWLHNNSLQGMAIRAHFFFLSIFLILRTIYFLAFFDSILLTLQKCIWKKRPVLMGKRRKNMQNWWNGKKSILEVQFWFLGGFLGVLGASLYWKVVLEFWSGHRKCHFGTPKMAKLDAKNWQWTVK